jgi:hypothetical protein
MRLLLSVGGHVGGYAHRAGIARGQGHPSHSDPRAHLGTNFPIGTLQSAATTTSTTTGTTTSDTDTIVLPPTTLNGEVSQVISPRHGSATRYDDPIAAARAFAVEFVGFDPIIVGAFQPGDNRSGDVEIRSHANASRTVVHVHQVDGDDWAVIGASNQHITITQPGALAEIESPMVLAGNASVRSSTQRPFACDPTPSPFEVCSPT